MSTNQKIRAITEKLPLVPKLHNGNIQHDGRTGYVITLNHFREIKEIYRKCGDDIELRNHLCGQYVNMVWDVHFKYKDIIAAQRREQMVRWWSKFALFLLITYIVIKLIF